MAKKKRKQAKKSPQGDLPEGLPPLPDRRLMDAMMRKLASTEPDADSPEGKAEDLLNHAYEEDDPQEQVRLAREGLEAWPDCADAYVLLADHASSVEEAIQLYQAGVDAGRRALGEEAFEEMAGDFWGFLETRPYMRARLGLAQALWTAGRREEAVEHYEDMLRLNPNDNQGVRYVLANCLLDVERHDDLQRLLDRYEERSTEFLFTRTLLAFRREGDSPQARKLLKKAAKENKYVADYLAGNRSMPRDLPAYVSPGHEDEAVGYVAGAFSAWRNTPGAISWVRRTLKLGLPEPAELPKPDWSQMKEALLRLPQAEEEIWEVDARPFPAEQSAPAPWVIAVIDVSGHEVRSLEPAEQKPSPATTWEIVLHCIRKPREGDPHRPSAVHVRQRAFWSQWKSKLRDVEVECRLEPELEETDAIFEGLRTEVARLDLSQSGAEGEVTTDPEQLADLPFAPEETWQIDARKLPIWIGEDKPYRPWAAMVVDAGQGFLLAHDLTDEEPTPDWLWEIAARAMATPVVGDPRRPGHVQMSSAEIAGPLGPRFDRAGVDMETEGRLDALDEAFSSLIKHLLGGQEQPSLVEVPGVKVEQVAGFYQAAADYYRRAPWRRIPGDSIIRIVSGKFQSSPWHAVVMGQSGMTVGLALYDDLKTLRSIIRSDRSEAENMRRTSAISVTYGEEFDVPAADLDAIERHHWPVAGPEAYPQPLRVNPGYAVRPPLAWELELLEGSLRAIPEFLEQGIDSRKMEVPVSLGEIELELTRVAS